MKERVYNPKIYNIKNLKETTGIYQIRNITTNKIYIGSTNNLKRRYNQHLNSLNKNKHENPYLQAAWNKYGANNFIFEIIEFCQEDVQFVVEQYWLDKFFGKNCYNINEEAIKPPNTKGKKKNITEQGKIRKKLGKAKPVVCLETGIEYISASEAGRILNLNNVLISRCCRGLIHTVNGLHWRFKKDFLNLTKEAINDIIFLEKQSQPVVCLETGKIYSMIKEASEDMNVCANSIINCCKGRQKDSSHLHWLYYQDYIKLSNEDIKEVLTKHSSACKRCICLENNKVYATIKEASLDLKINGARIREVCIGKRESIFGYHFKFL